MKKKKMRRRIRQLEQQVKTERSVGWRFAKKLSEQILYVSTQELPTGCDVLSTPVMMPDGWREDGLYYTAVIRRPHHIDWIAPRDVR